MIDDARRGRYEIEIEFALEAFGDDLEVQETEEATAEAEAQRGRAFGFERETCVIETKPGHRLAQVFEVCGVDGKETAEDDGLRRLEAWQRFGGRVFLIGDGVANTRICHFFDGCSKEADFSGSEMVEHFLLGTEDADSFDLIACVRRHQRDALALLQVAVDDAYEHDDAEIRVVPAVDEHRLQGL